MPGFSCGLQNLCCSMWDQVPWPGIQSRSPALGAQSLSKSLSCVWLFSTLWTVARQAPLSMGFSRQEYWSGLPCPTPGNLPNPGIKPTSLISPALVGRFFITSTTWEAQIRWHLNKYLTTWGSEPVDIRARAFQTARTAKAQRPVLFEEQEGSQSL